MQYIAFQKQIMKNIKIEQYEKVYFEYMVNNFNLIEFLNNRNKSHITSQNGACGINRKFIYEFDKKKFKMFEEETKGGYDISIHAKDDINEPQIYLHIMIDKATHIAWIQNISYYKNHVKANLEHYGDIRFVVSSTLLKLCIRLLKKYKSKYHVKKIVLIDNSTFTCLQNREKIPFAMLHTLLYGDTWFGKYGFRPYDAFNNKNDIFLTDKYEQNKKIVTTTLVKKTNIIDDDHQTLDEQNKNLTIDKYFRKTISDFQNSYKLFCRFYKTFYHEMNLYDFTGKSFYLDI